MSTTPRTRRSGFRTTCAFTRDLTVQAYLQPFVTVGDYGNIRRLALPKSFQFDPVTIATNPDFWLNR
jgi:hypothetical protein